MLYQSLKQLLLLHGSICLNVLHPTPIFRAIPQTFMPQKASQKLGLERTQFGAWCKTVNEIDP